MYQKNIKQLQIKTLKRKTLRFFHSLGSIPLNTNTKTGICQSLYLYSRESNPGNGKTVRFFVLKF
jgi:hypothetical protein